MCREISLLILYHRGGRAPLWLATPQFTYKLVYKTVQTSCVQAGFSSTSCSSSSLSSLTIPSSILSSLSLWPSRYLGLGAALVVNSPPGRPRSSPNRVSLASLSMAFAKQDAKESRDLCTSAWTWTEDAFSAEEKKNYFVRPVRQTHFMFSIIFLLCTQTHF